MENIIFLHEAVSILKLLAPLLILISMMIVSTHNVGTIIIPKAAQRLYYYSVDETCGSPNIDVTSPAALSYTYTRQNYI